jgi:HAD superfamily hydrolase (TIGR01490 family)
LDMKNLDKKIAIFDVDGTIFRSSLLIRLTEELIDEDIFPAGTESHYQKAREAWLNRVGSYEDYIKGVIAAFESNIAGVKYSDFRRIAHRVVAREKGRTYRFTRELVRELKKKKYFVMAISHSPKLAVENFCKTLGFSKVYGIMNEVKNGRFTKEILYKELIFDKAKILKRALAKGGLTLKGSIGAGDTESDIPFLKMVDRPICFNPNGKLYKYAKRAGWEIVVERKDVVYKI